MPEDFKWCLKQCFSQFLRSEILWHYHLGDITLFVFRPLINPGGRVRRRSSTSKDRIYILSTTEKPESIYLGQLHKKTAEMFRLRTEEEAHNRLAFLVRVMEDGLTEPPVSC